MTTTSMRKETGPLLDPLDRNADLKTSYFSLVTLMSDSLICLQGACNEKGVIICPRAPGALFKICLDLTTAISPCIYTKYLQSSLTLCDLMDCNLPGSSPWDSPGKNTAVGGMSFSLSFHAPLNVENKFKIHSIWMITYILYKKATIH